MNIFVGPSTYRLMLRQTKKIDSPFKIVDGKLKFYGATIVKYKTFKTA